MLPLSLAAQVSSANQYFSIQRSDNGSLDLHFELPAWKLESSTKDGQSSQKVSVADMPYLYIGEEETLPIFSTSIAIPYRGGASLSVLGSAHQAQDDVRMDFDALLSTERTAGRYNDSLYPANTVQISEPMVLRDFRIVTLNVYPFQYDQTTRQLHVNESIDIRISYDNGPAVNELEAPLSYSSAFDTIYRGMILNYDSFRDRTLSYTSPRMLVIYGNYSDTIYQTKVNEYLAWKRQKGFIVDAVSTSTAGTTSTAIKNYIQTQYNNASTRPDYIVLIGDTSGNIAIPTYNSYIDYFYTWLAGGDNLGDVMIGRISVETSEQMINYMAKIASLEQNINLDTAQWLDRMVLVADTAQSGISTIYTSEYIEDEASAVNPDYSYTEVYGSPSSTTINAAINQGVAIYNYRGYIGMSGWPSSMSSMNNQYKLFHAVFITCATGNFGGSTATTESVVRYGSASSMGGSVTAIGMATSSTATPQNNCLNYGIYGSIYNHGARDMSTAMLAGKLYLHAVYGNSAPTEAYNFAAYCNLIGDPTAALYVGIPSSFNVTHAASIPNGAAHYPVTVKDAQNQPVAGASVALTNSSGIQMLGFTDQDGMALLTLSSGLSGSLSLTVSKDDFKPAISTVSIASSGGMVYNSSSIDDDGSGQSIGNDDGVVNAGETIELYVSLRNTTTVAQAPNAEVMTSDPWFTLLNLDRVEYPSIAAGATAQNTAPILFEIASGCPDLYQLDLHLRVTSNFTVYDVYVPLTIRSGKLVKISHNFVGATGNIIYPGNQFPMTITLQNTGPVDISGLYGNLSTDDVYFSISDSLGYYGNIDQGMTSTNSSNTFTVTARASGFEGMIVPLTLHLTDGAGFDQSIDFSITIGQPGLTDPLGQDAYGYFIFDDGDTGYAQCPTYEWVGIAPAEGGSGTALALIDPGHGSDEGDQNNAVSISTVNLPFPFKFYGIEYSQASISANGFIAFGQTVNSDWRNWRLPDAGGPSPMIAVFWDDLEFGTGSAVYTYYDSIQHYYVVEWYNLLSGYNSSSIETFQAILYDPVFYPTHTGDGRIKLQYKVVNNIDQGNSEDHFPHGNFATVGIEDHSSLVGLEYTYNNSYPSTAQTLSNEMALFITTRPLLPDYPYIAIDDILIQDANSNSHLEPGESSILVISLANYGLQGATNVTATLSSADPFVTVNNSFSAYGDIDAQAVAQPQSNFTLSVSPSCPNGHAISFNLAINSGTGSWNYQFPLNVFTAEFELDNQVIVDHTGNQNGILDPGETATLTIQLINNGEVASSAGTATLSSSTPGITINNSSAAFAAVAPGAYATLSFSISAAAGMTNGTLVQLNFNVSAGALNYGGSTDLEVGAPLVITIGSGTSTQAYPLDRYYNYSAHEAIYLASEIGMAGTIKSLAFQKDSGSDLNPIELVSIYMKNTSATSLATGNYSTTGYTLVYSGTYPNNAASGWMEVNLNPMFEYDGTSNLAVLTVKGFQQWISAYPNWRYSTASNRARQNHSDTAAPTSLTATGNLPNILFRVFPMIEVLGPPSNLSATASHQSVQLNWQAPTGDIPTSYKLYRNSALLVNQTGLSYTDLAVTNGTTYTYHVTAVYPEGDSEASNSVNATPNAYAPTNLQAVAGNGNVSLNWSVAGGRSPLETQGSKDRVISSYRVYRNGSPIATVTQTQYLDEDVSNGTTYNYYVTTIYVNPAGESGPSDTVTATPNIQEFVVIGAGGLVNAGYQNAPLNICNNSVHGQSVYTAAELNDAGAVGPVMISGLGFFVASPPDLPLPNFVVRMKHTTAANASDWQSADGLVTTYSNASYMPAAGDWDMLSFSTPFEWNGVDNILVDTAFSPVNQDSDSGALQYTSIISGYRFAYSNTTDQSDVFSGGIVVNRRYNIRLAMQIPPQGPEITVLPASIDFGSVPLNTTETQQFSIQNTGDQELTGSITTPDGFSVAQAGRDGGLALGRALSQRNVLGFVIPAGQTFSYDLSFSPTATQNYSANLLIASDAINAATVNIPLSGIGLLNWLDAPVVTVSSGVDGPVLSWTAVANATSYLVLRASDPAGPYTQIAHIFQAGYTDTGAPGKAFYQVKAANYPMPGE